MKNYVRIVSAISTKDFSKIHWRFLHSIQPLHCNYCFGGMSYSQSWREEVATNRSIHHVPLPCSPTSFSSSSSVCSSYASLCFKVYQVLSILCNGPVIVPHFPPPSFRPPNSSSKSKLLYLFFMMLSLSLKFTSFDAKFPFLFCYLLQSPWKESSFAALDLVRDWLNKHFLFFTQQAVLIVRYIKSSSSFSSSRLWCNKLFRVLSTFFNLVQRFHFHFSICSKITVQESTFAAYKCCCGVQPMVETQVLKRL